MVLPHRDTESMCRTSWHQITSNYLLNPSQLAARQILDLKFDEELPHQGWITMLPTAHARPGMGSRPVPKCLQRSSAKERYTNLKNYTGLHEPYAVLMGKDIHRHGSRIHNVVSIGKRDHSPTFLQYTRTKCLQRYSCLMLETYKKLMWALLEAMVMPTPIHTRNRHASHIVLEDHLRVVERVILAFD